MLGPLPSKERKGVSGHMLVNKTPRSRAGAVEHRRETGRGGGRRQQEPETRKQRALGGRAGWSEVGEISWDRRAPTSPHWHLQILPGGQFEGPDVTLIFP